MWKHVPLGQRMPSTTQFVNAKGAPHIFCITSVILSPLVNIVFCFGLGASQPPTQWSCSAKQLLSGLKFNNPISFIELSVLLSSQKVCSERCRITQFALFLLKPPPPPFAAEDLFLIIRQLVGNGDEQKFGGVRKPLITCDGGPVEVIRNELGTSASYKLAPYCVGMPWVQQFKCIAQGLYVCPYVRDPDEA